MQQIGCGLKLRLQTFKCNINMARYTLIDWNYSSQPLDFSKKFCILFTRSSTPIVSSFLHRKKRHFEESENRDVSNATRRVRQEQIHEEFHLVTVNFECRLTSKKSPRNKSKNPTYTHTHTQILENFFFFFNYSYNTNQGVSRNSREEEKNVPALFSHLRKKHSSRITISIGSWKLPHARSPPRRKFYT